jgi:hypothetical protein
MNVTSLVAPSKAIIHHVKIKRPIPHTNPQVRANALTLNFIILLLFTKTCQNAPFLSAKMNGILCHSRAGGNPDNPSKT